MPRDEENLFDCMSRFIAAGIDPVSRHDEIWRRYGKTAAVLVVDSSGFSRVTKSHGIIHFLSRLMLLRKIAESIFDAHRCTGLHFDADNAFAYFDNVDDAVASALELHRSIYESRLMLTENERFRVSIGIGYGKMLYSETLEGYFSEEMNYASKLGEDLGVGDETRLTLNAYVNAQPQLIKAFRPEQAVWSGVTLSHYRHVFLPGEKLTG
jgi:class 3 adenylate cyclase